MPRRNDIKSILIIGSGPIIIGQACEFDYSGTQACKVLKNDGYRVVLINSNPATIMTDPETADEIYIEPITPENIKKIILKEKIDAVLPTIGGQTSLNMVVKIAETDFFKQHNIELIGADIPAINRAEDRKVFQGVIKNLGYKMIPAHYAYTEDEAMDIIKQLDFPVIIRSSFTLGGSGGSIAYNLKEYQHLIKQGIKLSMINEITVERSIMGYKEYELEVMKDQKDNVVIVCSIENLDPLGIHTGDSITVAPQQTLSDREYQNLRNMSVRIINAIGVSTGGANIQYAIDPISREVFIIEMNPRVSRSSALASKATGFPIAKIAAQLAVGYTLDEINNDITQVTPACFEPTLDYVVTKIPRFDFKKFTTASPTLGIQMKSVGEVMAIGRTFKESFQKAVRSLENKKMGFDGILFEYNKIKDFSSKELADHITKHIAELDSIKTKVTQGDYRRIYFLKDLFYFGLSIREIYELCKIETWYLHQLKTIFDLEQKYWKTSIDLLQKEDWQELKQNGFSDYQISIIFNLSEKEVRAKRLSLGITPNYKMVDTCAGEFKSVTPYLYSTYDDENELDTDKLNLTHDKKSVIIFGGGPNRIGQGIEFDYMCVQASSTLQKLGYHAIMVNSNPETVSTDYDVSDLLFFEPLTSEDTLNIIDAIKPHGVIIHLGGQTPLNLSEIFTHYHVPVLGTSAHSIELSENRREFKKILDNLNYLQPNSGTSLTVDKGLSLAKEIGYPVLVRPSYVLGGRAMKIVYDEKDFQKFFNLALEASDSNLNRPVLIDDFLEGAKEVDIDIISDQKNVVVCGILEHIEEAGVHSGDSACIIPPINLSDEIIDRLIEQARNITLELRVRGFMNIQFAIKDNQIYFIEANPRGSRTVPFTSKALGIRWTELAVKIILGNSLSPDDLKLSFDRNKVNQVAIKEVVLPFDKFPDEDSLLGPEMKSTGEVMGLGKNQYEAFYKAQEAIQSPLPKTGGVLISIKRKEYSHLNESLAKTFSDLRSIGFKIYATEGTHQFLTENNIESELVYKLNEQRPNINDHIINGKIQLIFNTPIGQERQMSDTYIRILAKQYKISMFTVPETFHICVEAIKEAQKRDFEIYTLKQIRNINA